MLLKPFFSNFQPRIQRERQQSHVQEPVDLRPATSTVRFVDADDLHHREKSIEARTRRTPRLADDERFRGRREGERDP